MFVCFGVSFFFWECASGVVTFRGERVYDELQEQNHLQEENKRQTSAIAVQPPGYCTYPLLLSCSIFGFYTITGFTELFKLLVSFEDCLISVLSDMFVLFTPLC